MRIRHNKLRNTGLIFEILVKQIASDTLSKKESPAVSILKKYFTGSSPLVKEFKLYQYISDSKSLPLPKAEITLNTLLESAKKLNANSLKEIKYKLISEIKKHYSLDEFFAVQLNNYKPLAAFYCLLEYQHTAEDVELESIILNKNTLLEHLSSKPKDLQNKPDKVLEDFSKYDKDLQLLTLRILLEKFNSKYQDLLPEQKEVLKQYITSPNSTVKLRNFINEELSRVSKEMTLLVRKVKDDVVKIKLEEIKKGIKPLTPQDRLNDGHLVGLMQYYELLHELKTLK